MTQFCSASFDGLQSEHANGVIGFEPESPGGGIVPTGARWMDQLAPNSLHPCYVFAHQRLFQVRKLGPGNDRLVFLSFDIYDIVIAENASRIAEVLPQINPEKRPRINPEIFDTIERWYQCPVAVCCFSTADEAEAKPIGFAYEPLFPDRLIVYTLDAHDGNAPQQGAIVTVDHTIFVGSYATAPEYCAQINYTDLIPEHLAPYLLHHAMGVDIHQSLPNGDIVFDTAAVRAGYFHATRKMPRYCPQQYSQEAKIERQEPYKTGTRNLSYGGQG